MRGNPIVLIVFCVLLLLLIRLILAWFGCAVLLLAMLVRRAPMPMPYVPVFVSAPAG
jgi:hypothetical protein